MKFYEILKKYTIETLEQLSSNKVMGVEIIRLPKEVLIEELMSIINKYSYINQKISLRNPPCFQMLNILIESENVPHSVRLC